METGLREQPLMPCLAQLPSVDHMSFARGNFFLCKGSGWLVLLQGQPAPARQSEPAHTGHVGTQGEAAWACSAVVWVLSSGDLIFKVFTFPFNLV